MVGDTLRNLIRLGKASKVKYQAFPDNLSELVHVVERHTRKNLTQALPWLPESKEEWSISEVWDKVLHTDILVNSLGWVVAVNWTINPTQVNHTARKLERVSIALSRLKIDRAVVVLVHQVKTDTPDWSKQLEAVIKTATQGDEFVSEGEIYF